MGYLVNISSDVQTQINSKQSILWNYNAGSGTKIGYLSPTSNCSLNTVRNDTNPSYIEMGNATNLTDTYIDFEDPTYTDYGEIKHITAILFIGVQEILILKQMKVQQYT